MYSVWKIMCFLNLEPRKHVALHQIHKIMLFLATSYDPFNSVYKNNSHSFIKLRLNHRCHMDYFNDVLTTFLGLELVSCVAVYGGSESSQISSKIPCYVF